jgi:hypothetical protein
VVEHSFAWLGRSSRRLAKDFEATIAAATAWLLLANPRLLTRRLAGALKCKTIILSQTLRKPRNGRLEGRPIFYPASGEETWR